MAEIRDFFSPIGKGSSASMAYLLLMANLLGLVVYLDSKQGKAYPQKSEGETKKKTLAVEDKGTNETIKLAPVEDTAANLDTKDQNEKPLEDNMEKAKTREKPIENEEVETISKNKKEEVKTKDNIIDFKEVVATRTQETKKTLEPLVWRFPKS